MNKQDRQPVRTAADLERKYDFGKIMDAASEAQKMAADIEERVTKLEENGGGGGSGGAGENGATFIPTVSSTGVISWRNDKGLTNPAPVNIKGPQGATGAKGDKGDKGDTGAQGIQGEAGENGVTFTPRVKDGVLSWTNDGDLDNPAPSVIKGKDGKDGKDGNNGVIFTPYVDESGTLYWENDGSLENPEAVNLKGADGYTPVKGEDYWTDEDRAEIEDSIFEALDPDGVLVDAGGIETYVANELEKVGEDIDSALEKVDPFGVVRKAGGIESYVEERLDGFEGGVDFITDETLKLENGVLSVNTASEVEADNTLPITSAAVNTTVGNIEVLLKTI